MPSDPRDTVALLLFVRGIPDLSYISPRTGAYLRTAIRCASVRRVYSLPIVPTINPLRTHSIISITVKRENIIAVLL